MDKRIVNNLPSVNDYKQYYLHQTIYEKQLQVLGEKINDITSKMQPIQKLLTEAKSVSYLYKDEFPIRQWNDCDNTIRFTLMGHRLNENSNLYRWVQVSLRTDGYFQFYYPISQFYHDEKMIVSNIKDLGEAKKAALELLTTGEYCVKVLSIPEFSEPKV